MPLQPNGAGIQAEARAQALGAAQQAQALGTAQAEQVFPLESSALPQQFPTAHADIMKMKESILTSYASAYARALEPLTVGWHGVVRQPQLEQPRPGAIDAFVKTCQRWGLADDAQFVLLGYASNPYLAVEFLAGRYLNLPQDVRDRTGYVVGISIGLGAVYNELLEAELAWLNRPHPKLRNQTPLAHMLQGQMLTLIRVQALVAEEQALR
jgi:hypothetical protein